LFSQLIYSPPIKVHARQNAVNALNAIVGFRTKIQAIHGANKAANKDYPAYSYITSELLKKTSKLSQQRNKIAHFKILRDAADKAENAVFVCPYFEFFVDSNTNHRLYYDDIINLSEQFHELYITLNWWNTAIYKFYRELPLEYQSPIPHHIHFVSRILPH